MIVMDVSKYSADNTASGKAEHETGGYMTPELLHWVLAQCEQAKAEGRSPLGMIHHSLVPHNGLQEPLFQNFILDNWREVTPALAKAGMRFTVTGHYHMDDTAVYRGKNHTMLYDMMSSSLSNFPNQYRMLRVANGKMFVDAVDCDRDAPITTAEQSYAQPYKYSFSFYRSFGENGLAAFGTQMIEQQLADLLKQVRKAGGTLNALQAAGVDPAQLLTQVFGTGLQLNGRELFSVNTNLMSFVKDFFAQLDELLLEDADYLNELLLNALDGLLNIQVSKKPCTAFIDTLGFGDKTKPGTFGDLVYSTLAYIYQGNEKPQEDAFYQDALAWLRNGGGSKLLQKIGRAVTEQILLDGVFTKIQFRPGTLFPQDAFAAEMGVFLEKLTLQWLYNDPSYSKLLHTLLPQKGSEKAANCPDPVGYLLAGAISLFVFDQSQDYGMQLALPSLSSSAPVVAAQAKKTAVATAAKAVTRPQTTKAAQTVQEELQETTEIIHLPSYQQADAGNLKAQATVMQENKLHRAAPFGLWSLLAAAILLLFFAGLRYSKRDKKVD